MLSSRGDSFQVMLLDWQDAFLKTIYLKSYFKKKTARLKHNTTRKAIDVRISLSVGYVGSIPLDIGKAMDEPFVLSGRALDQMKSKDQSFIITTNNDAINKELALNCAFLQHILDGWTVAQAEVIYYLVQGYKQVEIAEKLELSQPSVSNRIQLSNWVLIEKMNNRFVELMDSL